MSLFRSILGKIKQNDKIEVLSAVDFKSKISGSDVQLVDVRTAQEYENWHIEGAINVNFYSNSFEKEMEKFDKMKPVFLYCRSGHRSRLASYKLASKGFNSLYDLKGGILKWDYHQ